MTARARLPDRRPAETFDLEFAGLRYTVSIGHFPDGRSGEVFVANCKVGNAADVAVRDAGARRISPMALQEQSVGATDEWYTPRYIFTALGCTFDVDVASPGQDVTPWIPAKAFITSDSLQRSWVGFVWMNPPFGPRNGTVPWLEKFFSHGNGIALVPDRTSAPWWQRYAPSADLVLFVSPKIRFIAANGLEGSSPAQGTTLLAAGQGCRGTTSCSRQWARRVDDPYLRRARSVAIASSFRPEPRAMTRTRLPDRRLAESFGLRASGRRYACTVGWFPEGRLAEIFLTNHKAVSHADTSARDAAITFSIAVQHGADPEAVHRALCCNSNGKANRLGTALNLIFGQER